VQTLAFTHRQSHRLGLLRRTGFAASTRHFAGSISLWDNEGGRRALLVSQRAGLTGAALSAKITFA